MRTPVLLSCSALIAATVCMLTSTDASAQSAGNAADSADALTPSARAILRVRKAAHGSVSRGPAGPFLVLRVTPSSSFGFGSIWFPSSNTARFVARATNTGTILPSGAATLWVNAVSPSGTVLPLSSGGSESFPKGPAIDTGETGEGWADAVIAGVTLATTPFNQLPTFVGWLSGVANDGNVSVARPHYIIEPGNPGTGDALELQPLRVNVIGWSGNTLRPCFRVINKGASPSPASAKVRVVAVQDGTTLQTTDATIPSLAAGASTQMCMNLNQPGSLNYATVTIQTGALLSHTVSIVGAPNTGRTLTIPHFHYVSTIETL